MFHSKKPPVDINELLKAQSAMLVAQTKMLEDFKLERDIVQAQVREQQYQIKQLVATVEKLGSYLNDLGINTTLIDRNTFWWTHALKAISITVDSNRLIEDPTFCDDQQRGYATLVARSIVGPRTH